jgi:carboxyl-terminal processing protease
VIHDVLSLVARAYVDPARIRPDRMLHAARERAREWRPGLDPSAVAGAAVGPGADVAAALTAPLDGLLDLVAPPQASDVARRNAARAAILDAALRTLDRWSTATTGRARREQVEAQRGRFVGIGVRVGRRDGRIRVLEVFPGSGAEAAGLRTGDVLLAVSGQDASALDVAAVIELLRGPAGTSVPITLDGTPQRDVVAERRDTVRPTVSSRLLADDVGLVQVRHVARNTPAGVREALRALGAAAPPRGLVLDLRGNTGGSMLGAAGVANLFLREGVILEALDRHDRPVPGLQARVEATSCHGDVTTPIVVLVDRRTASSAELLSAALQWHGRATLVGERTFGKNLVGKLHHFEAADLTVKLSMATMRAASRLLPADGLAPDVVEDPGDAAVAERLARRLHTTT